MQQLELKPPYEVYLALGENQKNFCGLSQAVLETCIFFYYVVTVFDILYQDIWYPVSVRMLVFIF